MLNNKFAKDSRFESSKTLRKACYKYFKVRSKPTCLKRMISGAERFVDHLWLKAISLHSSNDNFLILVSSLSQNNLASGTRFKYV